ncbi:pantoate-beta-alanine ligase [Cryptococcus depauperatus CBS 7841]|uniref:Pantoate--beta-alanine ligase n=1 Tax=Cryptococcus depauperatus CBS 7841 TaxID=1295531 RepID=A0AAJ8M036_9TREE
MSNRVTIPRLLLKTVLSTRQITTSNHPRIPVVKSLAQLRRWRRAAREKGLEVGCVPTMGALHEGHLNLVRESMSQNPLTVMTVFVNPMQFAPHEDLEAYPRQLDQDISRLSTLLSPSHNVSSALRGLGISENDAWRAVSPRAEDGKEGIGPLLVFTPDVNTMYPLKGELQNMGTHKGLEVDVRGWGDVLEGASRPQFFKGVATVCTKLFNAVEPDHAYFGQKDIQQALLLKILVQDLLLSHPTPSNLHIVPTTRSSTGLALSSRNAYLSPPELFVSPVLYRALSQGVAAFETHMSTSQRLTGEQILATANNVVLAEQERIGRVSVEEGGGVDLKIDYIELFDKNTLAPIRGDVSGKELVLTGALWVNHVDLLQTFVAVAVAVTRAAIHHAVSSSIPSYPHTLIPSYPHTLTSTNNSHDSPTSASWTPSPSPLQWNQTDPSITAHQLGHKPRGG